MTMCVWCIPKNRQKSILNLEQNLDRKTAKRAYISIYYLFTIKKLSKGYQLDIKNRSLRLKTYQFTIKVLTIYYQIELFH